MNWDAIGAVGELLGSIAVLVTLAYLAVQVRHAQLEARRAVSQGRGEAVRELYALGTEDRINRLNVKADTALGLLPGPMVSALMNQAELTREEAFMLIQYWTAWWNYALQIVANIDELSAMERVTFDRGIRQRWGRTGVGRVYYEAVKLDTHPDAVRYIDNVLAQAS